MNEKVKCIIFGLLDVCCNNNTSHATTLTFSLVYKRYLVKETCQLDKLPSRQLWTPRWQKKLPLEIELFNKIEILRVEIDSKTMVDMILKTLPNSFRQFKLNYFMSKI